MVLDFFSREFDKKNVLNQYDYLYSAFYAHDAMLEKNIVGIEYGSEAHDSLGENIALSERGSKKVSFLGVNSCYTSNSKEKTGFDNEPVSMARIKSALVKEDATFEWVESTNEYDYLVYHEGQYHPLLIHPKDKMFSKAVVRIHS